MVLVPAEMGPVFHDRRQDVGGEERTAAKDGHEYGPMRARVGGKAAGGLHSMQILESSDFASSLSICMLCSESALQLKIRSF